MALKHETSEEKSESGLSHIQELNIEEKATMTKDASKEVTEEHKGEDESERKDVDQQNESVSSNGVGDHKIITSYTENTTMEENNSSRPKFEGENPKIRLNTEIDEEKFSGESGSVLTEKSSKSLVPLKELMCLSSLDGSSSSRMGSATSKPDFDFESSKDEGLENHDQELKIEDKEMEQVIEEHEGVDESERKNLDQQNGDGDKIITSYTENTTMEETNSDRSEFEGENCLSRRSDQNELKIWLNTEIEEESSDGESGSVLDEKSSKSLLTLKELMRLSSLDGPSSSKMASATSNPDFETSNDEEDTANPGEPNLGDLPSWETSMEKTIKPLSLGRSSIEPMNGGILEKNSDEKRKIEGGVWTKLCGKKKLDPWQLHLAEAYKKSKLKESLEKERRKRSLEKERRKSSNTKYCPKLMGYCSTSEVKQSRKINKKQLWKELDEAIQLFPW